MVLVIISVSDILLIQESICFKIEASLNALFTSVNSSAFKGWESSKPSIHFGKLILILSIGNS